MSWGRWLLIAALVVVRVGVARGDDFLTSSPGALAQSHASLDNPDGCNTCHEPDRSISAAKCLGCHDHGDLKARIDAGKGFHASPKAAGRNCKLCHQEHRGRSFDLMGWRAVGGTQGFDHGLTGWKLTGKHAAVACNDCHKSTDRQGLRTYLGADNTCGGCHKTQPHGPLRPALLRCDRCHLDTAWTPQKSNQQFDHDSSRDAAMPLEGNHADVACSKCHPQAKWKLPAWKGDCVTCHDSPHGGQLFDTKKCNLCHSPAASSLAVVKFDHRKDAGYALQGDHAQLKCDACHTARLGKRKPSGACETCHADDNRHGDRFKAFGNPPSCTTCHSQRAWKKQSVFDHGAKTAFKLTGKHAITDCRTCHRGTKPAEFEAFQIANGCMSCHQHKQAHGGKYANNECLTCHTEPGSKRMRDDSLERFHGAASRFPLTKAHAKVDCRRCHTNDTYENTPTECGARCHEDSLHKGTLGDTCSRCHAAGQWEATGFDHQVDTDWKLEGKHAAVTDCARCHPNRAFASAPRTCAGAGCHKGDDVHEGQLGAACERCHRTDGGLTFAHNRDAAFKLDGAHRQVVCAGCHDSTRFKPEPKDCRGCHAEPAVHKGRYGTDCARCHTTQTFGDVAALHDVGSFALTGAHDRVGCKRCHADGESRRGSGNLCVTCHRQDDVHQSALSPRCGECHTQQAFTPARFDHLAVGCNLMGQHRTLPCADCHANGNFGGVSPLCVSCHRADASKVTSPDHGPLADCGRCHNPEAWVPARGLGGQSLCR